jgi:hypothetical protein
MTSPLYVADLRALVDHGSASLLVMTDAASAHRPAPGKWSPREVIGHLIDSASNNHQRFVRAQFQDDLVFPGYAQDGWVEAQRYQDANWRELIGLWSAFNQHLARVMESMPEAVRLRLRSRHNLDEIAWSPVPRDTPTTLDYFMNDYVGHLEHHLRQILGSGWTGRRK